MNHLRDEKESKRDAILIIISSFIFGIAYSIYDPIWPFLVKDAGVSPSFYGFIVSGAQGFELLARWLSSAYSTSSMTYLLGSLGVSAATGILLVNISPLTILTSLSSLRMGRALHNLGRSQIIGSRFERKGTTFGATRVAWQVGAILGPALGALIVALLYRELIFILGVVFGILSLIVAYPFIKTIISRTKKRIIFWRGSLTPEARSITLLTVLNNFARQAFLPFHFIVAPFIFRASVEYIALAAVIERGISIVSGVPIGWLSDRIGERRIIMTLSELSMIIGILFYTFPYLGIMGFLSSTVFIGLSTASYAPLAMALVSETARERPEDAVAFLLTAISFARIPATLVTGSLIALYGYGIAFSFPILCFIIVGIGLLIDYMGGIKKFTILVR